MPIYRFGDMVIDPQKYPWGYVPPTLFIAVKGKVSHATTLSAIQISTGYIYSATTLEAMQISTGDVLAATTS